MNPITDFWGAIWQVTKAVAFLFYICVIVFGPIFIFAEIMTNKHYPKEHK